MKEPNVFACARLYLMMLGEDTQTASATKDGATRNAISFVIAGKSRSKGIETLLVESLGLTHAEFFPEYHNRYLTKFPNLEALAAKVIAHADLARKSLAKGSNKAQVTL